MTLPAGSQPITVLIRHRMSHADSFLFLGVQTDLSLAQLRWVLAHLLTEFERLPDLPGALDHLMPIEMVEVLWRCYDCRPVIRTTPVGFDFELELWQLYHDSEKQELSRAPELAAGLTRPGIQRTLLELMLASVRANLEMTVQQLAAGQVNLLEEVLQYRLLLRVLSGHAIDVGEGWKDLGERPYGATLGDLVVTMTEN